MDPGQELLKRKYQIVLYFLVVWITDNQGMGLTELLGFFFSYTWLYRFHEQFTPLEFLADIYISLAPSHQSCVPEYSKVTSILKA